MSHFVLSAIGIIAEKNAWGNEQEKNSFIILSHCNVLRIRRHDGDNRHILKY